MAQFDVHQNPGRAQSSIPYVVTLQSSRYDGHARRLVAPLVLDAAGIAYPELAPRFVIAGLGVVLDPLLLQSVPRERLGPVVASLSDDDSAGRIINALDAVTSRAYR